MPYDNLWVPLLLVPAGIVIAIVAVVALFGGLAGSERSMSENLALVVNGGKNQGEQALLSLAVQAAENQRARARQRAGEEVTLPWPMQQGFPAEVHKALEEIDADQHAVRSVLAAILGTLGDERGVRLLVAQLALTDAEDPDRNLRSDAIVSLGGIGDPSTTGAVLPFLDHEDVLLRITSAGALSNLPGEGVRDALVRALEDGELDVRATAAISGSKLAPPLKEAAALLRELTGRGIYEEVHQADPAKYRRATDVSHFRVLAVVALGRLGLEQDRALLEALRDDADPHVAEAAIRLLDAAGNQAGGGR